MSARYRSNAPLARPTTATCQVEALQASNVWSQPTKKPPTPPEPKSRPGGIARSRSIGSASATGLTAVPDRERDQVLADAQSRAEQAEQMLLELARRLRTAEARAVEAERDKAAAELRVTKIRAHVCHRFSVTHGVVSDDSDCYEGFLRGGVPEWYGVCRYANGDVYEGEWVGGQPHGWGQCHFAGGNIFIGQWEGGGYHGRGTYRYINGDKYEGLWDRDCRHGAGVFTEANGLMWEDCYEYGDLKSRRLRTSMSGRPPGSAKESTAMPETPSPRSYKQRHCATGRQEWRQHNQAWGVFEETPPTVIRLANVPWPPKGSDMTEGMLPASATADDRRRALKELLRRWHPDKWQGRNVHPEDTAEILVRVGDVFQRVRKQLQSER
eukprot:jgi/Chlat1/6676/Chrsp49S06137